MPLLERVKFAAIWESNLDEFFMVRVANLHDKVDAGTQTTGADGMSPLEQLAAIREAVTAQRARISGCVEADLRPALAARGIRIDLDRRGVGRRARAARPAVRATRSSRSLTPLVIGRGRPFPYISNLSVSLLVVLRDPEQTDERDPRPGQGPEGAARPLPDGRRARHLRPARRPDRRSTSARCSPAWRSSTTRSSGSPATPTTTSPTRPTTCCGRSRRSCAGGGSARWSGSRSSRRMEPRILRDQLVAALGIEDDQVYEVAGLLDVADLWDVVGVPGHDELRDPPSPRSRRRGCRSARRTRRATCSPRSAPATSSSTIPMTPSRLRSSASSSRRSPTRRCWRSSRPCTGRAPTRRWCRA